MDFLRPRSGGKRSRPLQAVSILALSLALVALVPAAVSAGNIVRNGTTDSKGTGVGTVLGILSLQDEGGTEYGQVVWDGTKDVATGQKIGGGSIATKTRTVAELKAAGISATNMSIVFNVNQEGGSLTLHLKNFIVIGYKASDGKELFRATFIAKDDGAFVDPNGVPLVPQGQGTGTSGYLFDVLKADSGSLGAFFAQNDNRLGITVESTQAINTEPNDGPDNFYVTSRTDIQEIPEPASLALAGIGAIGLAGYGWRRRRRQALAPK